MDRHRREHEWDLVQQALPTTQTPFGFVCGCGAAFLTVFATPREAIGMARSHERGTSGDKRAA